LALREGRAAALFDDLRRLAALEPPRRGELDLDLLDLPAPVRRLLVRNLRAIVPPNTWTAAGGRLGRPALHTSSTVWATCFRESPQEEINAL